MRNLKIAFLILLTPALASGEVIFDPVYKVNDFWVAAQHFGYEPGFGSYPIYLEQEGMNVTTSVNPFTKSVDYVGEITAGLELSQTQFAEEYHVDVSHSTYTELSTNTNAFSQLVATLNFEVIGTSQVDFLVDGDLFGTGIMDVFLRLTDINTNNSRYWRIELYGNEIYYSDYTGIGPDPVGAWPGSFALLDIPIAAGEYRMEISSQAQAVETNSHPFSKVNFDAKFRFDDTAVPEASSATIVGITSFIMLGWTMKRRKHAKA